ncbi:MAG TPA: YcaO-like family protein [Gaiellaceae bacterium]|nr:YcaO-like family protein [Gaiellaceae bacterium]
MLAERDAEDDGLSRLLSFASPYTGVVQSVVDFLHGEDDARVLSLGCLVAGGGPVLGTPTVDHSGGSGRTREHALAAALGEAVERYSATTPPRHRLVRATAAELGPGAIDPGRFALFHEAQYAEPAFPFVRFEHSTPLYWVDGVDLLHGRSAYLPAQLAFLEPLPDDPPITIPTSNGLACGATPARATLAALLEVVERDAFSIVWANRLSLPLLDWAEDPEATELAARYFEPSGLRWAAVDLSVIAGVPAALGVVRGPPRELGALGVGAGCAASAIDAWWKALVEAFSVRRWARDSALEDPDLPRDPGDVRTFDDHIRWYARPGNAERTAFLTASNERRRLGDVPPVPGEDARQRLDAVVATLASAGATPCVVDVTSADVADARLFVARAVVPELCPLDVVHAARALGAARLYDVPVERGLRERPLGLEELNPDPHPFP